MSDLISVSSLLKNSAQIEFANTDGTVGMYINVKAVKLEQQHNSIDAVEVVRCGKCRWASDYGEKYLYCQMNRDVNGDCRAVSKHGFCSYGERKE